MGEEHTVGEVNPNYGTKYPGYAVNTEKTEEYKVNLAEAGVTYEMNVYYDPEQAGYKLNYYKLNPKTNKYEYIESTKTSQGDVGKTYTVTDCDANYVDKYTKDGYVINKAKNETYSVVVEKEDVIYEMDVYYDPVMTTYKTEYYLKQSDGSYKLTDTVPGDKVYAGTEVQAPEKSYEGYVHVTTENTLEQATVAPDSSTVLKVYYNLEDKAATGTTSAPIVIVDTPAPAPVTTPAVTTKPAIPSQIQGVEVTAEPTAEPSEEPAKKPSVKPIAKPTVKPTKEPQKATVVTQSETPDTGDHTANVFALLLLMITSLGVAVDAALRARKKK